MISTGNDIVALKAINIARTKQPVFYSKFVNATEQSIYEQHANTSLAFEHYIWLLWSVKEAAYKYLQRPTPELIFSPRKLIVGNIDFPVAKHVFAFEGTGFNDESVYKGSVSLGADKLYFRSMIENDFIFSAVNSTDDFANVSWGIRQIASAHPDQQSAEARSFLIKSLNRLLPAAELQIHKNINNCPVLLIDSAETNIPVSIAHHDHYIAYSFQLF